MVVVLLLKTVGLLRRNCLLRMAACCARSILRRTADMGWSGCGSVVGDIEMQAPFQIPRGSLGRVVRVEGGDGGGVGME